MMNQIFGNNISSGKRLIMLKAIIAVIIILLMPLQAMSAEVVEHNGVKGFWFPEDVGTKILKDLEELKLIKDEKIPELELKIKKQDLMLSLTQQEVEVNARLSEVWQKNFKTSEELRLKETSALRKALDKKDSWYRSPALYLSLGLLAGGLLSVGLSFGLQETRN